MSRIVMLLAAIIAALSVGAIAFGAVPSSDGTIGACYTSQTVRLVDDASQCDSAGAAGNESFVKWNVQGLKGDPGPAGAAGVAGPAGPTGPAGGKGGGGFPVPAVEAFVKIDGVPGESVDAKHAGEIDVLGFDVGVKNAGLSSGSGAASGKATFRDLTFTHAIDKASPQLFLACATGKHFPKAVLTVRKSGGEKLEYYKVTLTDILVSAVQTHSQDPGAGGPVEEVSLSYRKIEVSYTPQKPDGSAGAPVKAGYDLKKGTKA